LERLEPRARLLGLPKVGELRLGEPAAGPGTRKGEDDVLELDVAVRDAEVVVQVLEGEEELVQDPFGLGRVEPGMLDEVGEEVAAGYAVAQKRQPKLGAEVREGNAQLEEDVPASASKNERLSGTRR